jgi:TPP-dependent pyruvate/acetoin dehydrogenase alpha subunit
LQTARLTDTGALDDAELAAMDGRVLRQIEEALVFAQASPWPEPQTLIDYVYA